MKLRLLIFSFLNFIATTLVAQTTKSYSIIFHPVFKNAIINSDNTYHKLGDNDSIQFETFKFYISGIELLSNNKTIWKEENSFHLLDFTNKKLMQVVLQTPIGISFNKIKFNLGIDSITNTSGAMGGDLDPTKGMYWTWQNGYINFKLEGKSNLCKTRNNEFQFHLGGYQYPFNTLQNVSLEVDMKDTVDISINTESLITKIDLTKQNQIMSPGKEAVLLSKKASAMFSVQQK